MRFKKGSMARRQDLGKTFYGIWRADAEFGRFVWSVTAAFKSVDVGPKFRLGLIKQSQTKNRIPFGDGDGRVAGRNNRNLVSIFEEIWTKGKGKWLRMDGERLEDVRFPNT